MKRLIPTGETIKKGEWYYYCCAEDFRQAEENTIAEVDVTAFDQKIHGLRDLAASTIASNYPMMAIPLIEQIADELIANYGVSPQEARLLPP